MEIAVKSFTLFLLFIFPGIVFRRFYYVGEFSKQFNSSNWLNTFYISLVPGLIIQIISYLTFENLIYKKPIITDFESINSIYCKIKNDLLPSDLFNFELIGWVLSYILVTIVISFIIAQLSWILVRNLDLDKKFSPLRFNNYWHYYLSGECLKFKDFRGVLPNKKVVLTEADVLVDTGNDGTKLYKGFVRQHTICRNTGDLKAIYLTDVRRYRRELPPNDIKIVPGHIMIIPSEKIININLTYITKNEVTINYKNLFVAILNLSILLFLMFNPSSIFLRNTSVFGDIVGRFWLFFGWLIFITTFETIANRKKIKDFKETVFGLFFFMIIIALIIYFFFYK